MTGSCDPTGRPAAPVTLSGAGQEGTPVRHP